MTFLQGSVVLPVDTPFNELEFWEYFASENKDGVPSIPVSGAKVVVTLGEGKGIVAQAVTNEDGEFVARVPSGERYFLEIYVGKDLVALGFTEVGSEKHHDVGVIDEKSTALAIAKKRELLLSEGKEATDTQTIEAWKEEILRFWRKGKSVTHFAPLKEINKKDITASLDPLRLFSKVEYFFGEDGHYFVVLWETPRPSETTLYFRPFHLPVFQKEGPLQGTEGRFVMPVEEFEGYLFFLEAKNEEHLLGRTPTHVVRAPFVPQLREVNLLGYQEGPVTVFRRETRGRKAIHFHSERNGIIILTLRRAQERGFELEMEFDLARKRVLPRCFTQEGFKHLTLSMYFSEDRSFFWGPVGKGVKVKEEEWQNLFGLWKKTTPEISLEDHFVEVGFGFPFVEIVGFFRDKEFRLFANHYLEDGVLLLSSRRLDSLNVESTVYYRGRVRLWGEGAFEGCFVDMDFEGKFVEDTEKGGEATLFLSSPDAVRGSVDLSAQVLVAQVRGFSLDTRTTR